MKLLKKELLFGILIMVFLVIGISKTLENRYYYTSRQINDNVKIGFNGGFVGEEIQIESEIKNRGLYGIPKVNYKLEGFLEEDEHSVFLYTIIDDLVPLEEYTLNVNFYIEDHNETLDSVKIGSKDFPYEVEEIENVVTSNYKITDEEILNGEATEFHPVPNKKNGNVEIIINSNQEGEAYLVFELTDAEKLHYNFSFGELGFELEGVVDDIVSTE